MIVSVDTYKVVDNIQLPFMTKILSKIETEGKPLNPIKGIYEKPTGITAANGIIYQVTASH